MLNNYNLLYYLLKIEVLFWCDLLGKLSPPPASYFCGHLINKMVKTTTRRGGRRKYVEGKKKKSQNNTAWCGEKKDVPQQKHTGHGTQQNRKPQHREQNKQAKILTS